VVVMLRFAKKSAMKGALLPSESEFYLDCYWFGLKETLAWAEFLMQIRRCIQVNLTAEWKFFRKVRTVKHSVILEFN